MKARLAQQLRRIAIVSLVSCIGVAASENSPPTAQPAPVYSYRFVTGVDEGWNPALAKDLRSNSAYKTATWLGPEVDWHAADPNGWDISNLTFTYGTLRFPGGYHVLGGFRANLSIPKPIMLSFDFYDSTHSYLGTLQIDLPAMPEQTLDLGIGIQEKNVYANATSIIRHVNNVPATGQSQGFAWTLTPPAPNHGSQLPFVSVEDIIATSVDLPTSPAIDPSAPAATHCYQVTFKQFIVNAIHSPNSDTDYAAMHLDLNNQRVLGGTPSTQGGVQSGFLAVRLGDIGNGTYSVDLQSAKVCMANRDTMRITYEVINHGNPSADTTATLQYQNSAYNPDASSSVDGSTFAKGIVALMGTLRNKSGCDDIMAGEVLEYTGADLNKWLHSPTSVNQSVVPAWYFGNYGLYAKLRAMTFTVPGGGGVLGIGGCKDSNYQTYVVFQELS